jgi:hypothetical protein
VPLSFWIVSCFLDDVANNSKIKEEPSEGRIQTPSDYKDLHEKHANKHVSGCGVVIKIKTSAPPYVKAKHHLQMSPTLSSQVSSNLIVHHSISS